MIIAVILVSMLALAVSFYCFWVLRRIRKEMRTPIRGEALAVEFIPLKWSQMPDGTRIIKEFRLTSTSVVAASRPDHFL